MSHKRKTRKEKENTAKRKSLTAANSDISSPIYSIPKASIGVRSVKKESAATKGDNFRNEFSEQNTIYLRQDIKKISAAAGLVVAFDIILYALLLKGFIRLPMFGY